MLEEEEFWMNQSTIAKPSTETLPVAQSSTSLPVTVSGVEPVVPMSRGGSAGRRLDAVRKVLLGCGVLSSILYVGSEAYAWTQYPGYSPISQAFSELLAEGAPTRPFMVAVAGVPYNLLVAALGVGAWMSAGRSAIARFTGGLLLLYAFISYLGGTVFQMDSREVEGSVRTVVHERATAVMVMSMLLAMALGAFVRGGRFRIYSLATLLTVIVFAGLTFQQVTLLAAHEPAPYLGLIERVNIYAWMLWVAVLSISFWHARTASTGEGIEYVKQAAH
jgi:Protein of unknown function (DUF998)